MKFITVGIKNSDILKEITRLAAEQPTVDLGYEFIRAQLGSYSVPYWQQIIPGPEELQYNGGFISAFHDSETNTWLHFNH